MVPTPVQPNGRRDGGSTPGTGASAVRVAPHRTRGGVAPVQLSARDLVRAREDTLWGVDAGPAPALDGPACGGSPTGLWSATTVDLPDRGAADCKRPAPSAVDSARATPVGLRDTICSGR